jgi:hypothetical protein
MIYSPICTNGKTSGSLILSTMNATKMECKEHLYPSKEIPLKMMPMKTNSNGIGCH